MKSYADEFDLGKFVRLQSQVVKVGVEKLAPILLLLEIYLLFWRGNDEKYEIINKHKDSLKVLS